jgi:hypothetical protein
MKQSLRRLSVLGVFSLLLLNLLFSREPQRPPKKGAAPPPVQFRASCTTAQAQFDMDINNVRARLLTGGDMWWDRSDGKYVVPKPLPGQPEVAAIYAAGIWMGGFDSGNNLKMACQTYGNNGGSSDYWPGPLSDDEGITDPQTCNDWDRHFEIKGTDIQQHLSKYQQAIDGQQPYLESEIPLSVKGWPARGNPYFSQIHGFDLPNTDQGLAGFFDQDGDGSYEPLDGDYPTIEFRGCQEFNPQFPDQMVFWIYNDEGAGAIHGETNGFPIRMEIQATAFAYATDDQLNDMTFQSHKFINRAKEDIDSTYFGLWVDADLGCYLDDYTGCDPDRNLAYYYNVDAEDGQPGITCDGVNTYGYNIPTVGIDIFRGPLDENGIELGMSSFMYFTNGSGAPGTSDPNTDVQFYRYLSGSWKDGTPLTYGGDGYDPTVANDVIKFAFPNPPNEPNGWSMCRPGPEFPNGFPAYDRRTVQSCGPFILQPGAVNELVFGVIWTPNMDYPCPDMSKFFFADDMAQCFFSNCFELLNPVDAPDVDWVELDREIVGVLSNKPAPYSNNYQDSFEELISCWNHQGDSTYSFEGYLIYQLAGPDVTSLDLDDPAKARLVFQTDLKNGVKSVFNWKSMPNPNYDPTLPGSDDVLYYPELQMAGTDDGVKHSFRLTKDAFAKGDSQLINHKKYYYLAKAYAFNQYQPFDPLTQVGQKTEYIDSRRKVRVYTVIPRTIIDQGLNAEYGDGLPITRIDGVGVGGNFMDMDDATLGKILNGSFTGEMGYKLGRGPVAVKVYNPLALVDGDYEITFSDENMGNDKLDQQVRWQLRRLNSNDPPITSLKLLDRANEEMFAPYGFSIALGQTLETGKCGPNGVGAIGAESAYKNANGPAWFASQHSEIKPSHYYFYRKVFEYLKEPVIGDCGLLSLAQMGEGHFVPYGLCKSDWNFPNPVYISPAWRNTINATITSDDWKAKLNNVDIFFTPDKRLWSRCVVVETFTQYPISYAKKENGGLATSVGDSKNFDLRNSPSVGKDDANGDGLPDPDGDGIGMGWFPGYAIDVETGKRLNIFFGENSAYSDQSGFLDSYPGGRPNGADMLFNPNDLAELQGPATNNLLRYYAGGQHFIYVTNEDYDGCAFLRTRFDPTVTPTNKIAALRRVTWTSLPVLAEGKSLLPLGQGLIPNEFKVKLRVENPYEVSVGTGDFNGYPTYRFRVKGMAPDLYSLEGQKPALALVNVVPNPCYNSTAYADDTGNGVVKITNLPARCTVTIYTLDGKAVRQIQRDEMPGQPFGTGIEETQILPDLEWNLKSAAGGQVGTGVYLIHVKAPGIGERTLKLVVI